MVKLITVAFRNLNGNVVDVEPDLTWPNIRYLIASKKASKDQQTSCCKANIS